MKIPAHVTRSAPLALALALGGCAALNDASMRALATPVPVLALLGERVLAGEALIYTDRSATLQLRSEDEPALSCMGNMRYTSSTVGALRLRCSDGSEAQFPYAALSETSGQGHGRTETQEVSLTYGLDAEQARAWLRPPAGKRLLVNGGSLRME
jgi:hypothetical protein